MVRLQHHLQYPQPRLDPKFLKDTIHYMVLVAEKCDQAVEDAREQLAHLTILLGRLEQRRRVTKD
jgi:hypothetical protein